MLTPFFQTHLNNIINIIIDVKNNELLLHSITVTAKSSKKNQLRQVNEKFHNKAYISFASNLFKFAHFLISTIEKETLN